MSLVSRNAWGFRVFGPWLLGGLLGGSAGSTRPSSRGGAPARKCQDQGAQLRFVGVFRVFGVFVDLWRSSGPWGGLRSLGSLELLGFLGIPGVLGVLGVLGGSRGECRA